VSSGGNWGISVIPTVHAESSSGGGQRTLTKKGEGPGIPWVGGDGTCRATISISGLDRARPEGCEQRVVCEVGHT